MGKTFNELFDDFFKRNNINPNDEITGPIKDEAKRMIDILSKITKFRNTDLNDADEMEKLEKEFEDMEKQFDDSLGKPDKTEFYDENGLFYEKRIWNTPHGKIEKIIISDDPSLISIPVPEKTLQDKLNEAIESEDYELAAKVRDEISKRKKNKK